MLIDNTAAYPFPKGIKPTEQKLSDKPLDVVQHRGNRYIGIHDYVRRFLWSPLPDIPVKSIYDAQVAWLDKQRVKFTSETAKNILGASAALL